LGIIYLDPQIRETLSLFLAGKNFFVDVLSKDKNQITAIIAALHLVNEANPHLQAIIIENNNSAVEELFSKARYINMESKIIFQKYEAKNKKENLNAQLLITSYGELPDMIKDESINWAQLKLVIVNKPFCWGKNNDENTMKLISEKLDKKTQIIVNEYNPKESLTIFPELDLVRVDTKGYCSMKDLNHYYVNMERDTWREDCLKDILEMIGK